jgi:hypothetical protein
VNVLLLAGVYRRKMQGIPNFVNFNLIFENLFVGLAVKLMYCWGLEGR